MRIPTVAAMVVAVWTVSMCGCSGGEGAAGTQTSAVPARSATNGGDTGIQPCKLLTAEQVATVLPGHDGGMVANAGGSFMKGVDDYQCSYTNKSTGLLTVVLNVAENDERFKWIKPNVDSHRDDRKVDVADGGWVYGTEDDLKVEVVKGRTVIDLELMDTDARAKVDPMVELARVVAGKIP